ncbi:MAG: flavodoxin [Oscillospiraceae bacterium]|nr:flavodoxin [Oscillospiraceae bacterium]
MSAKSKFIKVSALVLMAVMLFALTACGAKQDKSSQSQTEQQSSAATEKQSSASSSEQSSASDKAADTSSNSGKALVVYFSATGTTKGVAEKIAAATNADTYEILAAQTYTEADLNWNDKNSRTTKEQNDKSVRPEIGSDKVNLDGYSTIFIGYPIWWGEEPRIMDTFVESYDFSGKTMIPFCTSGGSGIGSSGTNLADNAKSGNWLEGERLSSSSDIEGWVKGLKLS